MAKPSSFNDPWDCKIPRDFSLLDTLEKRREYVDKLVQPYSSDLQKKGIDVKAKILELERLMEDLPAFQKKAEIFDFENFDRELGVLSLSETCCNTLMWSHYANNHKGYCIGFQVSKLMATGNFSGRDRVNYDPPYPRIDPLNPNPIENLKLQTLKKSKDWEYEKEFRFLKVDTQNRYPDESWRKVIVPHDCIARVVLGLRIEDEHKKEILEFCAGKQIPVFQATQVPREFNLDWHQIA